MKPKIYRVAERHALKGTALKVFAVSHSRITVPRDPMINPVLVGSGMDEADNGLRSALRDSDRNFVALNSEFAR